MTPAAVSTARVALVQGASRGIGLAMVEALLDRPALERVIATCRNPQAATALNELDNERLSVLRLDVEDHSSIGEAASAAAGLTDRIDLLINVAGILHDGDAIQPERRLDDVDAAAMERAFRVNALGSLLVARSFVNLLRASPDALFASLSARVGSISDNRLGGWYAYRASKAALNMLIRTLAVEWGRLRAPIRCVALHPGTVDTDLSAPFATARKRYKLHTPRQAADNLLNVLDNLGADASGCFLAWDGEEIPW